MEIIKVVPRGYCQGVVRAIQIAKKTAETYPGRNICMLGMIVHNRFVVEECAVNELRETARHDGRDEHFLGRRIRRDIQLV